MSTPNNLKNQYLPINRKHIQRFSLWGSSVGTDYWGTFNSGVDILAGTSTASGEILVDWGWTSSTQLTNTAAGSHDMFGGKLTPTTGNNVKGFQTPIGDDVDLGPNALGTASGNILGSPSMFGSYEGAYAAMKLTGKANMPRYLIAEVMAKFTVNSANEPRTGFGFFQNGGTVSTQAHQYAFISSNATNFIGAGASATLQTGSTAVDTTAHLWKIVLQYPSGIADASEVGPNIWFYKDGAVFASTPGVGGVDLFPLRFGVNILTTNRVAVSMVHIYYDW